MDDYLYVIAVALAWLLWGLAAGYLYHRKGYSFGSYFLRGLFLGPIALVTAVLKPKDVAALERRVLQSGMKKCPYCAEPIREEASVCRYCRREL